jgi:hypothetical protein
MVQELTQTTRMYFTGLLEQSETELKRLYNNLQVNGQDDFTQIELIRIQILEDLIVRLSFMLEDNSVFIDTE